MEKVERFLADLKAINLDNIDSTRVLAYGAAGAVVVSIGSLAYALASAKKGDPSLVSSPRELLHNKFSPEKVPDDIDVIVIGSGMSGLSCAAILARLGRKVLVLEQHEDTAGGGTHTFVERGYTFDSGLHYTVPWSVPVFALTCHKKPKDVVPFDLMGDANQVVDKIYLTNEHEKRDSEPRTLAFGMKHKEAHMAELKALFPKEHAAIDAYIRWSNHAMNYVKIFLFARLLPQWLQELFWLVCVPKYIIDSAAKTAQELLPTLTKDKKLISLLSSMWIDTGARPDKATFMLTGSVFRGVSMEGGCYPRGGSHKLAEELVPVIESFGGKVLIRALVDKVVMEGGKAVGVQMANGQVIRAKRGVVSSGGYSNTMALLSEATRAAYKLPAQIPGVTQSAGFVMCNIGIKASPQEIDATNTNTWHIPVDKEFDMFPPMSKFFNDPLASDVDIPVFITFPSLKDQSLGAANQNQVTVQILAMAEYNWFERYLGPAIEKKKGAGASTNANRKPKLSRTEGYDDLKKIWEQKMVNIFLKYFPKAAGKIDVVDLSTPLSIESWLHAPKGGCVGLDVTPSRFVNARSRELLDPVTPIPGLYMTGQDTGICGVTLCQLAGVTTALRMEGALAGARILAQSILLGN